jgi:hypothetical protein
MGKTFDRRMFLQAALAAGVAATLHARADEPAGGKLILSAPLTHSDWMLKKGIAWGEAGVRHMLDQCKACGWSRIYWRTLDGGRALYKSQLVRPENHWDEDSFWNPQSPQDKALAAKFTASVTPQRRKEILAKFDELDYSKFDSLAAAVDYGHKIGLEIHAWVSINEDDHGWGLKSDFAKQHPECRWVKRDGRVYHSQLSFAFPEVRAYKLAILDELLKNYDLDGVFLDWIRTGDVRDNPQTDAQGVADSGYEAPLIEAFKAKFGVDAHEVANGDERWVRLRAEPQTAFMREVRKRVDQQKRKVPLSVMVAHPWHYRGMLDKIDGSLRGLLLDVATWAREGLMDSAVAAGYYRDGGDAEKAFKALREETAGKVDVWTYAWVPQTVADVERDCGMTQKLGAQQVLFWEADYIDDRGNAKELQAAMSKWAKGT